MKFLKRSEKKAKQKHPRISMEARVFIHDDGHLFIAPLNNLSEGGLFVNKLVSLPEGKPVRITIKCNQCKEPIQAKGTIIRVETDTRVGTAVQFDWVSPNCRQLVDSCLGSGEEPIQLT